MDANVKNDERRRELLKHLILQLHEGEAPEAVKKQLKRVLGEVPYDDVVKVEQELISEGLPQEEVLSLCDMHTEVLKGAINLSGSKTVPAGHPVDTFKEENMALLNRIEQANTIFDRVQGMKDDENSTDLFLEIRQVFNELQDVEKHYLRKENLLFPFLEKKGITGPPTVMWGKHDETREVMKAAQEAFVGLSDIKTDEFKAMNDFILKPVVLKIDDMIYKEEQILFPMSLDTLTEDDWYEVYRQTPEIGFCLFDPTVEWKVENLEITNEENTLGSRISLLTGSFELNELEALFCTMPVDITFVDKDDTVRFFSHGKDRIFERNRAVIGRKVQFCHPPSSLHIVQKILDDFRDGRQNNAAFWINLGGKFVHIEYFAMRDKDGQYLGTLEFTQDLTEKRKLEGDRRLLKYDNEDE